MLKVSVVLGLNIIIQSVMVLAFFKMNQEQVLLGLVSSLFLSSIAILIHTYNIAYSKKVADFDDDDGYAAAHPVAFDDYNDGGYIAHPASFYELLPEQEKLRQEMLNKKYRS